MSHDTQADKTEEKFRQQMKMSDNLAKIDKSIIVLSGKGGVGKSTVSTNLAYGLVLAGKKVGVLDVDIHGPSIAKMFHIEGKEMEMTASGRPAPVKVHDNLWALSIASMLPDVDEPIVWRGPMKMNVIQQFLADIEWPELDYLIVDCPPGTGDEPLSAVQLIGKINGAIIVSTPQDVAFLDARKTIKFAQKLNLPILGIIENMSGFSCPHCHKPIDIFAGEGLDRAIVDFEIDLLGKIPLEPGIATSGDAGRPFIYDYSKKPAGVVMQEITRKIMEKLD